MRISFILLFLSLTINIQAQNEDCKKFKTGIFIDSVEELSMNVRITRTEDFQIEEYKASNMSVKLRVEWISDCTYKLVFIEGNEVWNKKFGQEGNPPLALVCDE